MFCESCLEKVNDATLRAEELPADAREHLRHCASCRKAVSEQTTLLDRMEVELRGLVNTEVPSSLLPKIRQRIAEEQPSWRLRPVLVYGTAFTALLGVAILVFAAKRKSPSHTETVFGDPATAAVAEASGSQSGGSSPIGLASASHESSASGKSRVLAAAKMRPESEVLISAEEQMGLQRYEAMLRARVSADAVVAASETQRPIKPLEIAELGSKQLTIEPLVNEVAEKDSME